MSITKQSLKIKKFIRYNLWRLNISKLIRAFLLGWAATVFIKDFENLIELERKYWKAKEPSFSISARDFVCGDLQKFVFRRGGRFFTKRLIKK